MGESHDLHVHLTAPPDPRIDEIIRLLRRLINQLTTQGEVMSQELDQLAAAVAEDTSVTSSAVRLLNDLAARLDQSANDPAAIAALASDIRGNSSALADAIAANTPQAPAPVEPPPEESV